MPIPGVMLTPMVVKIKSGVPYIVKSSILGSSGKYLSGNVLENMPSIFINDNETR